MVRLCWLFSLVVVVVGSSSCSSSCRWEGTVSTHTHTQTHTRDSVFTSSHRVCFLFSTKKREKKGMKMRTSSRRMSRTDGSEDPGWLDAPRKKQKTGTHLTKRARHVPFNDSLRAKRCHLKRSLPATSMTSDSKRRCQRENQSLIIFLTQ